MSAASDLESEPLVRPNMARAPLPGAPVAPFRNIIITIIIIIIIIIYEYKYKYKYK